MWCPLCQQEVPGVASHEKGRIRCARCRTTLGGHSTGLSDHARTDRPAGEDPARGGFQDELVSPISLSASGSQTSVESAWAIERTTNWALDEDLDQAEALLRRMGHRRRARQRHGAPSRMRVDPAHERPRRDSRERSTGRFAKWVAGFCCWTLLSLGIMSLVLGGALMGWSYHQDRPELWEAGIPCALGGQAALLLGLVMQLDLLGRGSRATQESLAEVELQLDELRRTTSRLAAAHTSPSQSFYAHLAEGASSQLLLADLKSQLDLLASRLPDQP